MTDTNSLTWEDLFSQGSLFDLEASDEIWLARVAGQDDLNRYFTLHLRLVCPVHRTVCPLAQARDQVIPSDRASAEVVHLCLPMTSYDQKLGSEKFLHSYGFRPKLRQVFANRKTEFLKTKKYGLATINAAYTKSQ